MKNLKLNLQVSIEIACTEPESFKSQAEFNKEDGKDMKEYVIRRLHEELLEMWQYAAKVDSVKIKELKSTSK